MFPFGGFFGKGSISGATHVTSAAIVSSTSISLAGRGVEAGDIIIIFSRNPSTPVRASGGAWNAINPLLTGGVGNGRIYWAVATSADIAGSITSNGAGFMFEAYRGATSLGLEGSIVQGGTNPLTYAGFTPDPAINGLLAFGIVDADTAISPISPASWTNRQLRALGSSFSEPNWRMGMWDRLYPANPEYVDGTSIVFTNSSNRQLGIAVLSLRA